MDLKVDWNFSGQSMGESSSTLQHVCSEWCLFAHVLSFGWALWKLIWHILHWILFKALALLSENMMVLQLGQMESQDTSAQMDEETDMA